MTRLGAGRRHGRPKGPRTLALLALIRAEPGIEQRDLIDRVAPSMPPAPTSPRNRVYQLLRSPAVTVSIVRDGSRYYLRGYPVPTTQAPWQPPPPRPAPRPPAPDAVGPDGLTATERYRREKAKRAAAPNPKLAEAREAFRRMEQGSATRNANGHRTGVAMGRGGAA